MKEPKKMGLLERKKFERSVRKYCRSKKIRYGRRRLCILSAAETGLLRLTGQRKPRKRHNTRRPYLNVRH